MELVKNETNKSPIGYLLKSHSILYLKENYGVFKRYKFYPNKIHKDTQLFTENGFTEKDYIPIYEGDSITLKF